MKKYFFLPAIFLFIAVVLNAQTGQKQTVKTTNAAHQTLLTHNTSNGVKAGSSVNSVTPAKTSVTNRTQTTSTTAIKRKHHKKSTPKKTGSK